MLPTLRKERDYTSHAERENQYGRPNAALAAVQAGCGLLSPADIRLMSSDVILGRPVHQRPSVTALPSSSETWNQASSPALLPLAPHFSSPDRGRVVGRCTEACVSSVWDAVPGGCIYAPATPSRAVRAGVL
ncbi:unnamed protein product [Arctogadus glacialis]